MRTDITDPMTDADKADAAIFHAMRRRNPAVHDLKVDAEFFPALLSGEKTFELRCDDRGYRAGDYLVLHEWTKGHGYTGRELRKKVTYLLCGEPWLQPNYVAMALADA